MFMAVAGTFFGVALTGFVSAKAKGFEGDQMQRNEPDERTRLIREEDEGYGTVN